MVVWLICFSRLVVIALGGLSLVAVVLGWLAASACARVWVLLVQSLLCCYSAVQTYNIVLPLPCVALGMVCMAGQLAVPALWGRGVLLRGVQDSHARRCSLSGATGSRQLHGVDWRTAQCVGCLLTHTVLAVWRCCSLCSARHKHVAGPHTLHCALYQALPVALSCLVLLGCVPSAADAAAAFATALSVAVGCSSAVQPGVPRARCAAAQPCCDTAPPLAVRVCF